MKRRILHIVLLSILLVGVPLLAAAEQRYDEFQLKAAIVFNIAKFVTWPAGTFTDQEAPLTIAVLGNGDTASGFSSLEGKKLGKRQVEINYLNDIDEFRNGQILYISSSRVCCLEKVLSVCSGRAVLTISDSEKFAEKGGMINLVKVAENIRFAINLDASTKENLQLSSKLNALAIEVIRDKN